MKVDKKIISDLMDKILPAAMCRSNSEDNIRLFIGHELNKFYLSAFADGQLNVLDYQKKVS